MSNCMELIYDRFGIEFYPMEAVTFAQPMMVREKFVEEGGVSIGASAPTLSVGNFAAHSPGKIKTNDTADDVTTTVKEKATKEVYEVEVHFEFKQADRHNVHLCELLDTSPHHIVLNRFGMDGRLADRRIIRNGEGHSRTRVTEDKGVINIDITITNVSGIQLLP